MKHVDIELEEVLYGAQYDHILSFEKDSCVNIGRLRFIYTIATLISSIG